WPEETPDLEKFYPTQVLVTARDIINLWVARMIIAGLEFCGEKPFSDVVIHASIMDDVGQRQSKSKGTGIDPLGLIHEYGADALRFALAWLCTGAQDIKFGSKLSVQRVEMSRNFVTKLWNAARYAASKIGDAPAALPEEGAEEEDLWILSRLSATSAGVTEALDRYEFGEAAQLLYRFVWNDFCDWYIELSKRRAGESAVRRTLAYVLDASLRLLHPFIPFVTEEIWQRLRARNPKAAGPLIVAPWPEVPASLRRPDIEERLELAFEAVRLVRDVRGRNGISPRTPVAAVLSARDERTAELLQAGAPIVRAQANVETLEIGARLPKPRLSATAAAGPFAVYVPLEGKIDVAAERERARRELERSREQAAQLERQLANEEFRRRKPELAEEVATKLEALQAKTRELEAHLRDLESA
ncbi:MAG: class I tRNA ligase family protein, partial [Planctomycetota bacterium]